MNKLFFLLLLILFCSCRKSTAIDYFEYKNKGVISVIQFHEIMHPDEKAIYIVKGKSENKVPTENFIKLKYCDYPAYYTVQNDTTILIIPGWDIVDNMIRDPKFIVLADFTNEDKIMYGYNDPDQHSFYKKIVSKYVSFDRTKLKMDW